MSEKFGLDWKQYDNERISLLLLTFIELQQHEAREADKAKRQAEQNMRKR